MDSLKELEGPVCVVLCGRSLCARAVGDYLAKAARDSDAPLEVLFDCHDDDGNPHAEADAVVVCASECAGHDDPQVYARMQERYPGARIVAISPRAHAWNLVTALDAGATGFVACGIDDMQDILSALVGVLNGEVAFSSDVSRLIVTTLRRSGVGSRPIGEHTPRSEALTDRENGVLALLCDGLSNQQIAGALGLSPNTVKNHLARIYRKLGVESRTEAISVAMRMGLE